MAKEVVETKVLSDEWKNEPMFAIFEVDEDGQKTSKKGIPVFSCGIKKAQHLIVHLKELEAYVVENS